VRAESIAGLRFPKAPKGELNASVKCAPHLIAANYRARYESSCEKKGGKWKCEGVLFLQTAFLGQDADDIILEELTPDAAMSALRCLEAGLRQSPELLGAAKSARATMLSSQARGAQKTPVIWANLMTADKRCLTVSFESDCDANGAVPLEELSGNCFDD